MDYDNLVKIKNTKTDLNRFKVVTNNRGSDRGQLLDKFLDRLNPEREANGFKPYSHARLAVMLAHLQGDELYIFYQQCDKANKFGAFFHWSIKAK